VRASPSISSEPVDPTASSLRSIIPSAVTMQASTGHAPVSLCTQTQTVPLYIVGSGSVARVLVRRTCNWVNLDDGAVVGGRGDKEHPDL
jgi:hypothetical protein